jgi:hypothetical protein
VNSLAQTNLFRLEKGEKLTKKQDKKLEGEKNRDALKRCKYRTG